MKKIISICMVLTIMLHTSYVAVSANTELQELEPYADVLTLQLNECGIYEVSNPNVRSGITVYADGGTEIYAGADDSVYMRIDETRFFKAEKVELETHSISNFSVLAEEYAFSSQLVADVTLLLNKVNAGEIELLEPIAIYVPERNISNPNTRDMLIDYSSRTYTGYNNRQYYEEIVRFMGISDEFAVCNLQPGWQEYLNKVFTAGAVAVVDGLMGGILGINWTLASVLGQTVTTSIPTTSAAEHAAKLIESKYIKYTSLYQGTEMYLGSVTEYTYQFRFQNILNFDGVGSEFAGYTAWDSVMGTGYSNADEYAYRYYLNTYHNPIREYLYTSEEGDIAVYVDSLY